MVSDALFTEIAWTVLGLGVAGVIVAVYIVTHIIRAANRAERAAKEAGKNRVHIAGRTSGEDRSRGRGPSR